MQPFTQITESVDIGALAVLIISFPLFVLFTLRARRGLTFPLRPIAVYERIRQLTSQATESNQPIHVGMGLGEIGSEATAESLMGLVAFDYVAGAAAAANQATLGTTGSGTTLATVQSLLQQAREEAGFPERYTSQESHFSGPEPIAYAAGTASIVGRRGYLANVLIGRLGATGLWIAEALRGRGMMQLGAASDPLSAALLYVSLDETAIGEELFAAGAYLHRPGHLGSLATQDILRIVLILALIVGVVMASLGYWS